MSLKEEIKNHAYEIGAHLVGFGNIERCSNAPLMMSPQGLMPRARTVVVLGLHHPDAAIELGGEEHPQKIGPYFVQYLMNARLDELSYRMATFIEESGFDAIPICSSNIWRYNKYKELNAVFAPDVSNIYMPVVAGLADMGFSGLAITPEYGARNRFVTIITDAVLEPDPLLEPGSICDNCMLCRKHCPTAALSKEIDGENVLLIEDKEYRFPKKNLWRCAWGEHFDLDLDLDIPDKVTEDVIIDKVKKYGLRRGEMGQCLKYCVPKKRRYFDRKFSSTPLRRRFLTADEEMEPRAFSDRLLAQCFAGGIESILVHSTSELMQAGINIDCPEGLPGAESAITLFLSEDIIAENVKADESEKIFDFAGDHIVDSACYNLTIKLEESGFKSVMPEKWHEPIAGKIIAYAGLGNGKRWKAHTVLTTKKMASAKLGFGQSKAKTAVNRRSSLADTVKRHLYDTGADLVGISSVARINELAGQLREHFDGEDIIVARDKAHKFMEWDPEISIEKRKLLIPEDYLDNAKSVIVLGLRYHREVIRRATLPPAEAVGPYSFQTYITAWLAEVIAVKLIHKLRSLGWRAVATADLMNTASLVATPRGPIPDLFSSRFSALAAGMGSLALNGKIVTPEFGERQRFFAVITDAEIDQDEIGDIQAELCQNCSRMCIEACPVAAMKNQEINLELEGKSANFAKIDNELCDWSKRYALIGDCGFKYVGSAVNELPHGKVTPGKLKDALKKHHPIKRYRPVVAEPCLLKCPYFNPDA